MLLKLKFILVAFAFVVVGCQSTGDPRNSTSKGTVVLGSETISVPSEEKLKQRKLQQEAKHKRKLANRRAADQLALRARELETSGKRKEAAAAWRELASKFPEHGSASDAKNYLAEYDKHLADKRKQMIAKLSEKKKIDLATKCQKKMDVGWPGLKSLNPSRIQRNLKLIQL